MSRRVAVLGASGQLGNDLVEVLTAGNSYQVSAFGRNDLDVTDAKAVDSVIGGGEFFAVINTAAMTNVDRCEEEGDMALAVNGAGPYLVARACARVGTKNVLIGTDFVFSGEKTGPYLENDVPAPVNVYGASKLAGERLSLLAAPNTLVARISSVFGKAGARGKGGNFVEAILGQAKAGATLKVVDDITMSPTYTVDVARALAGLLELDAGGVIHLANSGSCSWFEFAERILALSGLPSDIEPVSAEASSRPARRPRNSALASERLQELAGVPMRGWQDALAAYLLEKGHTTQASTGNGRSDEGQPQQGHSATRSEERR